MLITDPPSTSFTTWSAPATPGLISKYILTPECSHCGGNSISLIFFCCITLNSDKTREMKNGSTCLQTLSSWILYVWKKVQKTPHQEICQNENCKSKSCSRRHPKPCKYYKVHQVFKFGEHCCYSHCIPTEQNDIAHVIQMEITIKSMS